jgi:hypothetical protein
VDLTVKDAAKRKALTASATHKIECSDRNACDVELLSVGGFSPLTGFMNEDVYNHVVDKMRCAALGGVGGLPWEGCKGQDAPTRGPCSQGRAGHVCAWRVQASAGGRAQGGPNRLVSLPPYPRRLPGSNLLFGLPVVMDTNDPSVKDGSKVGPLYPPRTSSPDPFFLAFLHPRLYPTHPHARLAVQRPWGQPRDARRHLPPAPPHIPQATHSNPLPLATRTRAGRPHHHHDGPRPSLNIPHPPIPPQSTHPSTPSTHPAPLHPPTHPPPPTHPRQVLLTYKGQELGLLEVESRWAPNKVKETLQCYGTSKLEHPGEARHLGVRSCGGPSASVWDQVGPAGAPALVSSARRSSYVRPRSPDAPPHPHPTP